MERNAKIKNKYKKGYQFERKCRKWLEMSFDLVIRQGKSKFPDLIAINKNQIWLVECKYNGKITKEEVEEGIKLAKKINALFCCMYSLKRKIGIRFFF